MFIKLIDNGTDVDVISFDVETAEGFVEVELDGRIIFNYDLEEEIVLVPTNENSSLNNALNTEAPEGSSLSNALDGGADGRSSLESALDQSNSSGEDAEDDLSEKAETIQVGSKSSLEDALNQ